MSYQLPDLLGLVASLTGDGDLHISPLYQADMLPTVDAFLASNAQLGQTSKTSRLQRRAAELLQEYNSALLASMLFPFPSFPEPENLPRSELELAAEWLAICAVTCEDVLRPGRIVDSECVTALIPKVLSGNGSFWEKYEARMSLQSSSPEAFQAATKELLHALSNIPERPKHDNLHHSASVIQKYVEWRAKISGHRLLFDRYFSSDEERSRFGHALTLVLEISACVMDLFSYNIHQAWYSRSNNDSDQNQIHLNLVAFLMIVDPEMTLQGAIYYTGEMIRQRITAFEAELDGTKHKPTMITSETTKSSFNSLLSLFSSFRNSTTAPLEDSSNTAVDSPQSGNDPEIRKVLLNWLSGVVHWAYEVEYFYPDIDRDDNGQSGGNKKRGSEVRDYGWVFLIKEKAENAENA